MVLSRFLPKDEQFFAFFADAAANAAQAASVLATILAEGARDTEREVRHLRDLEHRGDEISHRIFSALHSTFVTPLDRDDIQHLASRIDDFVDLLEEIGKRYALFRIEAPTPLARQFAQILIEQGNAIVAAVPLLEKIAANAQQIRTQVLELHRLENEGDELLNTSLATLYDGVEDIPQLIHALRWRELYQLLEDASDAGEDIADVIEGMLITYA